jgi:hypothetical protein
LHWFIIEEWGMVDLTVKQVQALKITGDALVQIRRLARQPATPQTMAAIHDLADALHNVPRGVTRRPENPNLATMFDDELDRDIESAASVFRREGLPLCNFPPDVEIRDENFSAYVASGARFHVPAEKQPSVVADRRQPRPCENPGSFWSRFFKRPSGS